MEQWFDDTWKNVRGAVTEAAGEMSAAAFSAAAELTRTDSQIVTETEE